MNRYLLFAFSDLPEFGTPNVPRCYRQIMDEKKAGPAG